MWSIISEIETEKTIKFPKDETPKEKGEITVEKKPRGRPKGAKDKQPRKKGETRGRPKGVRHFKPDRYKNNIVTTFLNNMYYGTIEAVSKVKIAKEDRENILFGESICYLIDYYIPNIPYDHPISVLLISLGSTFMTVVRKKQEQSKVTEIKLKEKGKE